MKLRKSTRQDVERIIGIWCEAVDATHEFLQADDRAAIEREVRDVFPSLDFLVAVDDVDCPIGFMLLDDGVIEALFIEPARHRQGIGRALVNAALARHGRVSTTVNEQNRRAFGFYERLGFRSAGRMERDGQGRPYPLIRMRLDAAETTLRVRLTDVELEVDMSGDGTPLFLLHGALGDRRTLAPVASALSAAHRTIVPTLRHFGPPPRATGRKAFGTASQAEDLIDLLDALGFERAHVVAWSYSAHSALAAAFRRPDRFASLFLYEPGFPTFVTEPGHLDAVSADGAEAFGPVAEAARRSDWAEAARRLIDGAARREGWFDGQPAAIRRIHLDNADTIGLLFGQTPPVPLSASELGTMRTPVTVAWGDQTRTMYALVAQAAAAGLACSTCLCVPGAGHLMPEEDPAGFAALVARHMASPA